MIMPVIVTEDVSDADLLRDFLLGHTSAQQALYERFHPWLLRRVGRYAPDLVVRNLREDVVQQLWLRLLSKPPSSFNPAQCTVLCYLNFLLRTAAREVRAMSAAPGQRTRQYKNEDGQAIAQPAIVSLDEPIFFDGDVKTLLIDTIPDVGDQMEHICSRDEAEWYLRHAQRTAPEPVPVLLRLVYEQELPITHAASLLGIDRFVLRRHMRRWIVQQNLSRVA